ncbi:MAG: ketoacyl-ACP synthase III [Deltaproteobacteria bacterium]|nr:ketoacyl-ACP synthase III [Deltaproteobacteria bacterium]
MPNAFISGTGFFVPPRVVTNDDLAKSYGIDTTHEWVVTRTGIEQRHFAEPGIGPSDLGEKAARDAIERAGLKTTDIGMILFATLSPEYAFPGSGVFLQEKLGLEGVPAMDIRNQCSGFLYGLSTAAALVESGSMQHVLVVGAEVHSAALDLSTRGRAVSSLFGDGAGAVVVSRTTSEERKIMGWVLGADGRYKDMLAQRIWDTRQRPFIPLDGEGNGVVKPEMMWAQMNGRAVFKHAVEKMCTSLAGICWQHKLTTDDLDLVVFHQANMRINQTVQELLGLPPEKVPHTIRRYGNTTAATIPITLAECEQNGQLKQGMTVALAAFGSGFTWGAALVRW